MGEKNIFVNATAATEGGILTVLIQFIDQIQSRKIDKFKYYIFVSTDIDVYGENIKIIRDIKGKKMIDRLKWDIFGMKKWAQNNHLQPDLIISLQNTGVFFKDIPQIVYLHQPLPYAERSKWSLFKCDERKLWVYKNIYKLWIDFTIRKKAYVVVQTYWMKDALIKRGYLKDKIIISKPNISNINIDNVKAVEDKVKYLFYPAADYKYKNHMIIIKAIRKMSDDGVLKGNKFKIIFTLSKDSIVYKNAVKFGVAEYIEAVGQIPYEKVLSYYKGCQAVLFPSYIETFGLPLIESSAFGKKLLVSDCEYSREVLTQYELAKYILFDDENKWAMELMESLKEYKEKPYKIKNQEDWKDMFELINRLII